MSAIILTCVCVCLSIHRKILDLDEAEALAVLGAQPVLVHEGLQGGVGGAINAAKLSAVGGRVVTGLSHGKQSSRFTILHLWGGTEMKQLEI